MFQEIVYIQNNDEKDTDSVHEASKADIIRDE